MKNLTLENKQISILKDALVEASRHTTLLSFRNKYNSVLSDIEHQFLQIDESDPQQVWDELKKEVERVTEVWKDKISGLLGDIPDYSNQSKVSYLIDKIEQFVTYMNEIENNL